MLFFNHFHCSSFSSPKELLQACQFLTKNSRQFFWIDNETLMSRLLNYKNSAFVEWAMPSRRVLISFGRLYLHVYCILFVKSVTAGINFYKYPENSI